MYNKKVLTEATKKLDRTVAPAKKKDIIVDQEGQRKYPGQVTKIMGDTMATDGYGYIPLMVYPNNGQAPQLINPNTGDHYFPGATEFTEVPVSAYGGDISIPDLNQYEDGGEYDLTDDEIRELKKGGYVVHELPSMPKKKNSKRYSRSLMATNQLFAQNPLLKKQKSKKKKIFNPDSKYYAEGGFHDDLGKHRQLIRDWTYGQSIGMLHKAQDGYENKPAGKIDGEDYYNSLSMTNRNLQEVKVKPKSEQLGRGNWLKYQREFQSVTPYEEFARERRKKYIRRTPKGLNKALGVTEENFPEAAETRIKQAYERKLNTYMAKRIADDLGFDPSKRGEWVDIIMDPENTNPQVEKAREIFSKSDYQGKLQKPVGARFLSGLQQTANVLLPKSMEFDYEVSGYTPTENKRAKTDWTEPLEIFSPGEYIGAAAANALVTNPAIAGTEGGYRPGILSGELRGDVTPDMASAFDPTNLLLFTPSAAKNLTKVADKAYDIGRKVSKKAYNYVQPKVTDLANATITSLDRPRFGLNQYEKMLVETADGRKLLENQGTNLKQWLSTPSNLLKLQTVGATAYNSPKVINYLRQDSKLLDDPKATYEQKLDAINRMSYNMTSSFIGALPLGGKFGNALYSSTPSTVMSFTSNAAKLKDSDPESMRALFNAARLLTPARKDGGEMWEDEIDDDMRKQLEALGYVIEDID